LTLLITRSIHVQELDVKKATELEVARIHLVEMAIIDREVLKQQAIFRAEENKKNILSSLKALIVYKETILMYHYFSFALN